MWAQIKRLIICEDKVIIMSAELFLSRLTLDRVARD
jgi:hypothetical protein